MSKLRSLPLCGVALALFSSMAFCSMAVAQNAAPAVRITSAIDENQLVTLSGNVNPHANAQNDRGSVGADFPMRDLVLVLSRGPAQQAAFDAFVQSQYDPGSPNFHQWLTPAQIGQQYGPASADIATLTGWLSSHGFAVGAVAPDRMTITFSGSAGQVEDAFHTQIHNLVVNGKAHYANMTDPQIPAALAPVMLGVKGLHNFLPRPLHRMGAQVQRDSATGKWQRLASAPVAASAQANRAQTAMVFGVHPEFGINVPANSNEGTMAYLEEDVTPYDFATIYNLPSGWPNTSTANGSGQTIAIAGTSDIVLSDVSTYRSAFGLPAGLTPEEVKGANGLDPGICTSTNPNAICGIGDLIENSLDVELSGAVAPGAQIVLVTSGYNQQATNDAIYQSAYYVVENHGNSNFPAVQNANILSISYGQCELNQGTASNVAYNDLWQTAASEGISVFVATGDSGSPSCDQGADAEGNPYSAQYGLSVNGIASTPYNTAVGGTDFAWCMPTWSSNGQSISGCASTSASASPYWNATNNTTTGESAANYIPEIPWNDTCENPIWAAFIESTASSYLGGQFGSAGSTPEEACNWVQNQWYDIYETILQQYDEQYVLSTFIDTVGGGGGVSGCVSNDTDTDPNNPTCNAGATSTGATNNPSTGEAQASLPLVNNGWPAPSWQTGSNVPGTSGLTQRAIPDVSFFAGDGALNSATLVCVSDAGSCVTSSQVGTNPVTTEPTAQEIGGTSVATPEMAGVMALINQKAGTPQGLAGPELYKLASMQTYSSCSSEQVKNNTAGCYFNDVDQGTNAMPCDLGGSEGGSIYENGEWVVYPNAPVYAGFSSPNCAAINAADSGSVGTLVLSPTNLTPAYNAGVGFDMATGLGSLNVANVVSAWASDAGTHSATLNVTLSPTGTIQSTTALTVAATVTGADGTPTGSIAVSGGGYSGNGSLNGSGQASITIPAGSLTAGSDPLTITYSGDATYASASTTETVNVAAAVPNVAVAAPSSENIANQFVVTVTVGGPGTQVPTGTVTLAQTGGTYSSPAKTLTSGTASITIGANSLTAGTDTLTATYSGDTNYTSATGSATIVMSGAALLTPTVTVTPTESSIDSSQSLDLTVKVTGSGVTPTGTVTLSAPSVSPAPSAKLDNTGSALLTIPQGTFTSSGTPTITVQYSGDGVYALGSGSTSGVTVTPSSYTLAATTPSAVSPGSSAASTITGNNSSTYYEGTVTLNSCTLTQSPSGAVSLPTCSVSGTITYSSSGTASGSGTATVGTTAASGASLVYPNLGPKRGNGKGWLGAGGGAVLAFLVFLGIPARRRSWRAMLGMVVLLITLGSLAACGGGGSGNSVIGISATTAGSYTFTVTGTGNDAAQTTATTTFTVTVQ